MELFYQELKRLAAGPLRRAIQGHSRRPTLLVNELYLQLVKVLSPLDTVHANYKAAFFWRGRPRSVAENLSKFVASLGGRLSHYD
jgi:hypothetical protein